jgi:hypothetical protein
VNKDDLQGVCRWIEAMYREILKKYRVPITSDSAADWLSSAKMTTADFRGLHALVDNIRMYASYLDTTVKINEAFILKYVKRALQNTDRSRSTSRNDVQCLEIRFKMQYNLYVKSVNETEEQQRAAMDNTCNSLVNLLETDKAERRVDDGNNGNKGGYKRYEKKNNFNPTMRHNAFLDRRVEFEDNEEVDEDNAGGDEDYYGGNYSGQLILRMRDHKISTRYGVRLKWSSGRNTWKNSPMIQSCSLNTKF